MVFGPWIEVFTWLKGLRPHLRGLRRPHFNFITIHYIYLITLTFVGSVILYGSRNIRYIDALFFASGCATQSGLNTVNVNDLHLYQQVAMYIIACISNPIFINTAVVFTRLYWFEKRFQNIVLEAQRFRRTRSKARTTTETKDDHDTEMEERGVGGRKITVMHPGPKTIDIAAHLQDEDGLLPSEKPQEHHRRSHRSLQDSEDDSSTDAEGEPSSSETSATGPLPFRREITFADEVRSPTVEAWTPGRMPVVRSADQHIAFLENQRNPKDKGVLYIPGPRDFDRGDLPQHVEDELALAEASRKKAEDGQPVRSLMRNRFKDGADDASTLNDRTLRSRIANKLSFEDGALSKAKQLGGWFSSPSHDNGTEGDEGDAAPSRIKSRSRTFASFLSTSRDDIDPMPYLTYQPTVGRNSAFVNLNEAQREELGGIEYRALKTLAVVLCSYFFGFHLLGAVCLIPWMVRSGTYGPLAEQGGFNRVWWGIFTPASMFNDLGFTLTPDSMISFQRAVFPLLFGSFLIIIGNTGFPCMLRLVIWIASKLVPRRSSVWEELHFLLDHPRRCFTLLFPSTATWWLFWILVVLNGIDVIFFIVLDLKDEVITALPPAIRVLDGVFQAASTRTAGFADVNLANLHPAIQVSYLIMMYISIFPTAISVRRTNVYEEKSLGIWGGGTEEDDSGKQSYVGAHLRRQLSFDLWYVFLGLFIISIAEGNRLQNTNEYAFTLFSVLFEVVSAYGTVGLSLGYPDIDASFSAEFSIISKLVIIAMQIRGRHRGLPYALDKAILLPSEGLQKKEEDDATQRIARRNSMASQAGGGPGVGPSSGANDLTKLQSTTSSEQARARVRGRWSDVISQALSAGPVNRKAREL